MISAQLGQYVVSFDPEAPRCGRDCECCAYPDGTTPADHARDCDLITLRDSEWSDCTCEAKR